MFSRKGRADITPDDPLFYVRYVGFQQTFKASGKGCTRQPAQTLWDQAPEERKMKRIALTISLNGITIKDLENRKADVIKHDIKDISYCSADRERCPRLFCWICKNNDNSQLECHVVLCSSPEKAQAIALVLSRAFQLAYKEWKQMKARVQRMHGNKRRMRTQSDQAIPSTSKQLVTVKARTQSAGDAEKAVSQGQDTEEVPSPGYQGSLNSIEKEKSPDGAGENGGESKANGLSEEAVNGMDKLNVAGENEVIVDSSGSSFGENDSIIDFDFENFCSQNQNVLAMMKGDVVSELPGVSEVSSAVNTPSS